MGRPLENLPAVRTSSSKEHLAHHAASLLISSHAAWFESYYISFLILECPGSYEFSPGILWPSTFAALPLFCVTSTVLQQDHWFCLIFLSVKRFCLEKLFQLHTSRLPFSTALISLFEGNALRRAYPTWVNLFIPILSLDSNSRMHLQVMFFYHILVRMLCPMLAESFMNSSPLESPWIPHLTIPLVYQHMFPVFIISIFFYSDVLQIFLHN